jgi:hypothetical protein
MKRTRLFAAAAATVALALHARRIAHTVGLLN